jgi:hypothetical protein
MWQVLIVGSDEIHQSTLIEVSSAPKLYETLNYGGNQIAIRTDCFVSLVILKCDSF